jgi:hypothetical protein
VKAAWRAFADQVVVAVKLIGGDGILLSILGAMVLVLTVLCAIGFWTLR